jgi:phage FluMu protein Com
MAKCPYCKGEVTFQNIKKENFIAVLRPTMFICPHCDSILGFI